MNTSSANKVLIVGCGNMGYAMLIGWIGQGILECGNVVVVEPMAENRRRAAELGVRAVASLTEVDGDFNPRMLLVAVKPQMVSAVLPDLSIYAGRAVFVSIAAGVKLHSFAELLGPSAAIIRAMPNTPAAIGKGMIATCANANVMVSEAAFVESLLKACGETASLSDEAMIDAVTAISGSGPAYVFYFIECLIEAAKSFGFDDALATKLANQTVYGAAAMAAHSDDPATELRRKVTSPNGTTEAALDVLLGEDALRIRIQEAARAAFSRSVELQKSVASIAG